ncbi:uncharacterized protein [Physcomitrium patens]|uniref:Pentacotripeptide-repeat region of PRORP domain-containing protein n=1 Tax=Physcomitrium patens TaxID=3218 RepID=A0A2K1LBB8_PHYPA|nr:pentatricopeptide repeat-containing protein At2g30780-like [Physcomitrium patens]PNR63324.1 hypothetical protein PHYPA_001749 [Physcomitrium patens]|eukprot:XP_024384247.1 pentatricopeptide repeat-containing protein At2g30780-like [Physcomitrella patens]
MRSGNQLNPLLRTLGRLCLNGGTYSTSQEVLLTASIQAEDCIRRDVHRTPYLQSEIKQNTNSGFGIRESKFRATNVSHLVNSASCLDFVRGSSALLSTSTKGSALRPPDAEELQRIPFRRKGGDKFARSRTNYVIAALVKSLESSQSNAEVVEILEQKAEEVLRPNGLAWLSLLDALQKGPKPHIAMEVFNWKKSKLRWEVNPKEYAKMISFAGRINQPQLAADLFDEMEKRGIKKTAVSYNALIHSYGRNNEPQKALQLFEYMKVTVDCQPTLVTYNTLISMYSRMGATEEMKKIFLDCTEAEFVPDRHTYNALIWGYMRAGQLNEMEVTFNELQAKKFNADVITYNALIIGYARANAVDKMEVVLSSMQAVGIPINTMVGEILIEVYSRMKNFDKMEGALKIIADTPGIQFGSRVHSMVIESYADAGKLDEAEAAIKRMFQSKRVLASSKALHALIMAYSRAGTYDRLAKTMEVVKDAGWMLQPATYNILISEYGKVGYLDKMEQAFREMMNASVKPSFETFQYMINAYEAADNETQVDRILDLMRKAGCEPKSNAVWTDDKVFSEKVRW